MDEPQLYAQLTDVVRDVLDDDTIVLTAATRAKDVRGWDSATHIEIIVSIEARYGIRFTTPELGTIENVGDIVKAVERKLAKRT